MECPKCGNAKSSVLETRKFTHSIWRQRICHNCAHRYTTTETCNESRHPNSSRGNDNNGEI